MVLGCSLAVPFPARCDRRRARKLRICLSSRPVIPIIILSSCFSFAARQVRVVLLEYVGAWVSVSGWDAGGSAWATLTGTEGLVLLIVSVVIGLLMALRWKKLHGV